MRGSGGSGRLIDKVDVKAYLHDNFERNINLKVGCNGIIITTDLDKVILATILNPSWTETASFFLMQEGVLKILDNEGSDRSMYTWSSHTVGSWEIRVKLLDTIAASQTDFNFIYYDSNNRLYLRFRTGNDIKIGKKDTGESTYIIEPNVTLTPNTWYIIKITRDVNGNFELFVDEDSKGTVQDSFLPTPSYIFILNSQAVESHIDYLTVT